MTRQVNYLTFRTNLKLLLCLLATSFLLSCKTTKIVPKQKKEIASLTKSNQELTDHQQKITSDTPRPSESLGQIDKKKNQNTRKKAVILIHGINSKNELNHLQKALAKDLNSSKTNLMKIVALNRNNDYSCNYSIEEQANFSFRQLEKKIPDIKQRDIVLFGNSQGGLLAWELYNLYKKQLNIKGIITNHTPWEGAPAINMSDNEAIISELTEGLVNVVNESAHLDQSFLSRLVKKKLDKMIEKKLPLFFKKVTVGRGAQDIAAHSTYLQKVAEELKKNHPPIFALGGYSLSTAKDLLPLMNKNLLFFKKKENLLTVENLAELAKIWDYVVGGGKVVEHDLLVPTTSQIAENIRGENFDHKLIFDNPHFSDILAKKLVYQTIIEKINMYFAN
jgi:pimeloyl-ACP methyl ester carboxylesterase